MRFAHITFTALLLATVTAAPAQENKLTLRPYAPGTPQLGLQGTPERPGPATLKQDEDWSWLADPSKRTDYLDGLKYISLDASGRTFLTFGLESFVHYEFFRNEGMGASLGSDATLNTRFNPHVGLTFGDRFRLYAALKHGWVFGNRFEVPPADRDKLDLHQAFAEVSFGDIFGLSSNDVFLRAGRQDLHYGAGRLIAIREGPNIRRDFEGALVRARVGPTIADVFGFRPTTERTGYFDNGTDERQLFQGLYTTTAFAPQQNVDLYYIRHQRDRSQYAFLRTSVDETRHTVGARYWLGNPARGWAFDFEGGRQFGDARQLSGPELDIRAWYFAGSITYAWANETWSPVMRAEFGTGSGDQDPNDDRIETFRALFPAGRYFGDANPFGPGNLSGIRPSIEIKPSEQLTVRAELRAFWRNSKNDGVYTRGQTVFRRNGGRASFVGYEPAFIASYAVDRHLTIESIAAYFVTGKYFDDNPPGSNVTCFELIARYRF